MSRPLLPAVPVLGLAYAAGLAGGALLGGPWALSALVTLLVAVLAALEGESRRWLLVAAVALAGSGHARIAAVDAGPLPPLASLAGQHEVVGVVRDDAVVDGTRQRIDLDVETVDGIPRSGGIRLRLFVAGDPLQAGERLRLTATLEPPPPVEAFDYAAFLRDRDIYLVAAFPRDWERTGRADLGGWRGALLDLRRMLVARIERTLPEPAAALASGVLVGERNTLPAELDEALRATGTTHLIVVSGQNVALLLAIAVGLLNAVLSRRSAAVVALAFLPAYVVFVGAEPPVVRAAVMAVAIVAASITGRRTPGWVYLVYAVAGMLALDPALVRDVAFQLSAAATAGITILAPALRDATLARWPTLASPVRTALVSTAATATGAAVAVLPVQVAAFQVVAPWTVVANVLVAPLYEATVCCAFLAAFLGGGGPLGLFGDVLALVPQAFIRLVETLAALPFTRIPMRLPLVAGVVFVTLLVAAAAWLRSWTARHEESERGLVLDSRLPAGIGLTVGLAVVAASLWWMALAPRETLPTVTVLDVGQGLAVIVRDGGSIALVDAGPPDGAVVAALSEAGVRERIDALIVSHTDSDHLGGLRPVVSRFGLDAVYLEPSVAGAVPAAAYIDIGDTIRVGAAVIEVLAPPVATRTTRLASDNDGSLVLLVTVGDRRILLTGDIEAEAEAWLVRSGHDLQADVLVVPHHGSRTSSTPVFLDAVSPLAAVIPVGQNTYGHPHSDVLARYAAIEDLRLFRTDEHGNVTIRTDGDRLWIATSR